MKYLITGKNGQLAQAFISRFEKRSWDYSRPGRISSRYYGRELGADAVAAFRPDIIINCAAYNLVDKAEQDEGKALLRKRVGARKSCRGSGRDKMQ